MKQEFSIEEIYDSIDRIIRQHEEYIEKELAEIIQKYDFIVGSKDTKYRLMKALPKGANIVYSTYIEDPTVVYAVKKFNIKDWISEPYKEEQDVTPTCKIGKWVKFGQSFVNPNKFLCYSCSECGLGSGKVKTKFCPNCGCLMEIDG